MTGDSTMTWTSPVFPKLYSNDSSNPLGRPITPDEDAWIGSLVNIGAMIGPLLNIFIAEKFGRKIGLLCIAIPHLISFLTLAFARTIYLFYFARLIGGLSEGAGYALMPMYVSELAQDSNRGMISATLNCFWTFGNLIPYLIGPYLTIMQLNIVLACLPAIFFFMFLTFAPETPHYLVHHNRMEEAERALKSVRHIHDPDKIKAELEHIKSMIDHEEHGSMMDIVTKKPIKKAMTISLVLVVLSQMSGINAILFYTQFIFNSSGTTIPDDISSMIFGLVLFASSFTVPFTSDKLGRKKLMIISSFGTALSLLILGLYFYLLEQTDVDTDPIFWLPICSLLFYIIFFNFGLGPLVWTISSELFPNAVKTKAAMILSSCFWLTSFVLTKVFNDMKGTFENCGTFWFYSAFATLAGIFSIFQLPETKGKSFFEIQRMLEM